MPNFEYKLLHHSVTASTVAGALEEAVGSSELGRELEDLGNRGWELVSVVNLGSEQHCQAALLLTFKRERQQKRS